MTLRDSFLNRFFAFAVVALTLTACPDLGVVCRLGTNRCGNGCADFQSDNKNCGACGIACQPGQLCSEGQCGCQPGTEVCGGNCTVTQTDPQHCGSCDAGCASEEVCETGVCRSGCTVNGATRCSGACVDLQSDFNHCGACGRVCNAGESCRAGRCGYEVVAACFTSGQVTGLSNDVRGALMPMGNGPAALASLGDTLLSADGLDRRLYQAQLYSTDVPALTPLGRFNATGAAPNQVLVDGQTVYVVNSESATLQVLQVTGADSGTQLLDAGSSSSGGLSLAVVAEISFGSQTYPEGLAKLGNELWVPLYGGFGAAGAAAGQKVARVDISNPAAPNWTGSVDLSGVNLSPFDGGNPVPRPLAVVAHQGKIYVALNNLNPDSYSVEGPGLLAKIDPGSAAVSTINLGDDVCLDPVWLVSDGQRLFVSCVGSAVYSGPPNYALISTEKAAVVMLDAQDVRRAHWAPACPVDVDAGCAPILPSRFTVSGNRVYLGDQNAGRVFVLEVTSTGLVERRGYAGSAGGPIQACGLDPMTGLSNVGDVYLVP